MFQTNFLLKPFIYLFLISSLLFNCKENNREKENKAKDESKEIFDSAIMMIKDTGYKVNLDSIYNQYSKIKLIGKQESIDFAKKLEDYAFSLQFKSIDEEVENREKEDSLTNVIRKNNLHTKTTSSNTKSFTFVLTHLLGKELEQNAHFKVGDMNVWTLDMRNGSKIKYTITGRVGNDPMCGLTAKDSFGDVCAICIEKRSGDNIEVEIRYSAGTMKYKGFLKR